MERAVPKDGSFWALLGLNQRPTDYESAALTAELRALVIEWKDKALPFNHEKMRNAHLQPSQIAVE